MAIRIDPGGTLRKFGDNLKSARVRTTAAARAAAQHLSMIQGAFADFGADPVSGALGVWPAKKDGDPSRLQDTGRLLGGISFVATAGAYEIGPEPLPYAPAHQFGEPDRGLPQRAYIIAPQPWTVDILTVYVEELTRLAAEGL